MERPHPDRRGDLQTFKQSKEGGAAIKWGVGDSKGGEGHEKKKGKEGHPGWDRVRTDVGEETAFPNSQAQSQHPTTGTLRLQPVAPRGAPRVLGVRAGLENSFRLNTCTCVLGLFTRYLI